MANKDKICCSFCGKTSDQVRRLLSGPNGVYICDECIELCSEILEEELDGVSDYYDASNEINLFPFLMVKQIKLLNFYFILRSTNLILYPTKLILRSTGLKLRSTKLNLYSTDFIFCFTGLIKELYNNL